MVFTRFVMFMVACVAGFKSPAAEPTFTTLYSVAGAGDGAGPQGGFISVGGVFHAMTTDGGATGNGTIIKVNLATGAKTLIYSFAGGADGSLPFGNLLHVAGTLN
jgi:uncharacterized repeat protein (TIGR03803 family)